MCLGYYYVHIVLYADILLFVSCCVDIVYNRSSGDVFFMDFELRSGGINL